MRLTLKFAIVVFLTLAILVPLGMVHGTIEERQAYREHAVQTVSRSYAGPQSLLGPVLVVPYVETIEIEEAGPQGIRKVQSERNGEWVFFPSSLSVDATLKPDTRKLGLHEVRVYELAAHAVSSLRAEIPADADPLHPRRIGRPWLSVGISDVRGIVGAPRLTVDGRALPLSGGFGSRGNIGGLHARLAAPRAGDTLVLPMTFDIVLGGTESLAIVPIAKDNRMAIASRWPHPRFGGSFLPRTRSVDANGFRAQWDVSSLATAAQAQFLAGAALPKASADEAETSGIDAIGLSLVDPVNVYLQAERATKYGILFVLLTFVGFFMFELIKALPIHPIQYMLVGLALAIFFLLLVSLSEHIAFGIAYLVSAVACIGLLAVYLTAVLRSSARALGFAAMLATLYAALYGLLVSEDNALVLGAGLLFAILATIMVVTRKIDWYALQNTTLRTA
jgi:inner membrane protein